MKINKVTNSANGNVALNFYDTLTEKQKEKFEDKNSFTIEYNEVSNIYSNLNDHQTRILFLAISMYASTGTQDGIDSDVYDDLYRDPLVLLQFNNMANRIMNHTKSYLNGQGQKKDTDDVSDIFYDNKKGCWRANPTPSVKSICKERGVTMKDLNETLRAIYDDKETIPDIYSDDFELWEDSRPF